VRSRSSRAHRATIRTKRAAGKSNFLDDTIFNESPRASDGRRFENAGPTGPREGTTSFDGSKCSSLVVTR